MHPRERADRRASLHDLRAVLCAFALLWVVVVGGIGRSSVVPAERAGAPAATPALSADRCGVAAPDSPGVPLDPLAAFLECVSEQEFQKGKSKSKARDAKQAPRHVEVDPARASNMALPTVDETPSTSVRLVAYPSRAPPRC